MADAGRPRIRARMWEWTPEGPLRQQSWQKQEAPELLLPGCTKAAWGEVVANRR